MIVVCLIILLPLAVPFIRVFFKRLVFRAKLVGACRGSGAGLYPCRVLWWLFHSGGDCDFLVTKDGRAWAVRLMAVRSRSAEIIFRQDYYTVMRSASFISAWGVRAVIPVGSKPKLLPRCDIPGSLRDRLLTRSLVRCLLINPVCAGFTRTDENGAARAVFCGDTVGGSDILTLYDARHFLSEIKNDNQSPLPPGIL